MKAEAIPAPVQSTVVFISFTTKPLAALVVKFTPESWMVMVAILRWVG